MSAVTVRPARPEDREGWMALWQAYNAFYDVVVPDDVSEVTWQRILDEKSHIGSLVACEWPDGAVLGFANYIIHPRTWSVKDTCYLEDLYVYEGSRGQGIGKMLCEAMKYMGERKGLDRIYWNTRESNMPACKLYDQIATRDDFVRYVMPLEA
jgi:GNAT superfamily N-acetyltransferase